MTVKDNHAMQPTLMTGTRKTNYKYKTARSMSYPPRDISIFCNLSHYHWAHSSSRQSGEGSICTSIKRGNNSRKNRVAEGAKQDSLNVNIHLYTYTERAILCDAIWIHAVLLLCLPLHPQPMHLWWAQHGWKDVGVTGKNRRVQMFLTLDYFR